MERNDTFITAFDCGCGRPIRRADRTCGCCFTEGFVTLQGARHPFTGKHRWEIFMGKPEGEPVAELICINCAREVISVDRRCECGAYYRLELRKHEVAATSFAPTSYRWELHRFGTTDDVPDRLDVRVIVAETDVGFETALEIETDHLPEPSESFWIKRLRQREKERDALRKEAIRLLKDNSYRKTADLLGISLGKLQYLVKED